MTTFMDIPIHQSFVTKQKAHETDLTGGKDAANQRLIEVYKTFLQECLTDLYQWEMGASVFGNIAPQDSRLIDIHHCLSDYITYQHNYLLFSDHSAFLLMVSTDRREVEKALGQRDKNKGHAQAALTGLRRSVRALADSCPELLVAAGFNSKVLIPLDLEDVTKKL